jgi:hypothetical protein
VQPKVLDIHDKKILISKVKEVIGNSAGSEDI